MAGNKDWNNNEDDTRLGHPAHAVESQSPFVQPPFPFPFSRRLEDGAAHGGGISYKDRDIAVYYAYGQVPGFPRRRSLVISYEYGQREMKGENKKLAGQSGPGWALVALVKNGVSCKLCTSTSTGIAGLGVVPGRKGQKVQKKAKLDTNQRVKVAMGDCPSRPPCPFSHK